MGVCGTSDFLVDVTRRFFTIFSGLFNLIMLIRFERSLPLEQIRLSKFSMTVTKTGDVTGSTRDEDSHGRFRC